MPVIREVTEIFKRYQKESTFLQQIQKIVNSTENVQMVFIF